MRFWRGAVASSFALLLACGGQKQEQERGLGEQVGDTGADTAALKEANEAAGTVIRAAPDCDAVKAALQAATPRLDAVAGRLKTATGRASLDSIRQQVKRVAEACP
jgi:type VI protein secretion system component VasF